VCSNCRSCRRFACQRCPAFNRSRKQKLHRVTGTQRASTLHITPARRSQVTHGDPPKNTYKASMLTGHSIKAVYLDTKGLDIAEIFTSCRADAPAGHHAGTTTADRLRVLGILKKVVPSQKMHALTNTFFVT
jgi:hypothetical protein